MDIRHALFGKRTAPWILGGTALAATVCLIVGLVVFSKYQRRAGAFDLSKIGEVREQSTIYDAGGEVYSTFGDENRTVVKLAEVSPHFTDALLAREDRRFRQHGGVDYFGIFRAAVTNFKAGRTKQGASTITQQLAKNAYGLEGRTLDRKILEAMLARRIERRYGKDEILELYVNRIYFGAGFHGIEAASQGYFGKPAKDLSVGEAAVLAGLIKSPSKLAPTRDAEAARVERDAVIDRMVEAKTLTAEEAAAAKATLVNTDLSQRRKPRDSVTDALMAELEATLSPEVLQVGGLKVYMTIDPRLQRLAENAVDQNLTAIESQKGYKHPRKSDFVPAQGDEPEKMTDYLQGALVAIENKTGAIRAAAGTRDYTHSKYSRALSAKRPVGSTFKPFVFAAAFERGLLPGTLVDDSRIEKGELRNVSKNWSPDNSDDEYKGPQPAAVGLLESRNTMTVRVGQTAGLSTVRELGRKTGLSEDIPDLPGILLGAFESTVKDLTAAYTVFPNLGTMAQPHLISKVEDAKGNTLVSAPAAQRQVLDPGSAWMVSSILQEVMKSGTASKSAKLGWKKPGGGKTGTTNDFFDAWFVGYTSSLTCGVWVGFDRPQTIGEKAYGSALALPIWVDFMKAVPEGQYPAQPIREYSELAEVKLCKVSGLKANPACSEQGCAYESTIPWSNTPLKTCESHVSNVSRVAYEDTVPPAAPASAPAPAVAATVAAHPTTPLSRQPATVSVARAMQPAGTRVPPAAVMPPPASAVADSHLVPVPDYPNRVARRAPLPVTPPPAAPVAVNRVPEDEFGPAPSAVTTTRAPAQRSRIVVTSELPPPVDPAAAPAQSGRTTVYESNGTMIETPVRTTPVAQAAPPPTVQDVPVRKASRAAPAKKSFSLFSDDDDDDDEENSRERSAVTTRAPAAEPVATTVAVGPESVAPAATGDSTDTSGQPRKWVEKRGNRTITTTVVPVRKAEQVNSNP